MILSGAEIKKRIGTDIIIEPFVESRLNPNSYNLCLHEEIWICNEKELDMRHPMKMEKIIIPLEGYVMEPFKLYLARTMEYTETRTCAPMIEGRSSIGRMGLFTHVTAGFGDVGFKGYWTLEMFCMVPLRIYAGIEIVQTYYHEVCGENTIKYEGKYQNNSSVQSSMLYKDFLRNGRLPSLTSEVANL